MDTKKMDRLQLPKPWPQWHFLKQPWKKQRHIFDDKISIWGKKQNPLENATRQKIHEHENGDAATFKHPPGGMVVVIQIDKTHPKKKSIN